ncbi:ATP-binding domain-containing protein [Nocardioides hwasunensis]|uniref:ATP-binding domain-containing protein n=1 Tax=Nocardioides hwasunensis TaxID=397258 RepID=UPI001CD0E919|nr:ATP-binding domain-containing protein [Nocardioides hwasunensis]
MPTSIRQNGVPVRHSPVADLDAVLEAWLAENAEGTAVVISARDDRAGLRSGARVRWLPPELAKGLEFDLVVLVEPETFGGGITGAVDRYVAMTRATQQLVVLTD